MTVAEREDLLTLPKLRAVQLLEAIAGDQSDQSDGYIEVRFLPPIPGAQNQRFFCVSDPGSLLDAVDLASTTTDAQTGVYVGAALRVLDESGELGGTAQHVERCHVLLADLDDDEALDAYSRLVQEAILPLATFIVESGGVTTTERPKLHVYWALSQGVEPELSRTAKRRIAAALGSDSAVADPARVMRMPCSRHVKEHGGTGREVRVTDAQPKRRYALDDVVSRLPGAGIPNSARDFRRWRRDGSCRRASHHGRQCRRSSPLSRNRRGGDTRGASRPEHRCV